MQLSASGKRQGDKRGKLCYVRWSCNHLFMVITIKIVIISDFLWS